MDTYISFQTNYRLRERGPVPHGVPSDPQIVMMLSDAPGGDASFNYVRTISSPFPGEMATLLPDSLYLLLGL